MSTAEEPVLTPTEERVLMMYALLSGDLEMRHIPKMLSMTEAELEAATLRLIELGMVGTTRRLQ